MPSPSEIRLYVSWLLVCFLMICLTYYAWKQFLIIYNGPWSLRNLLNGFKAKMWMTFGLGIIFFSLYGIIVVLSPIFLSEDSALYLFFKAYQSPLPFIYAGLFLFACFSLSIYLVRMLIKYIYITRGKGN